MLDQRCGECVLKRLAILERYMADRLHRVEILREADRQARGAELDDETVEEVKDRIPDTLRSRVSSSVGDRHQGVTPSAVANSFSALLMSL